jgi:diguanylate cyclase (GGDEF)-like protein
MKDEVARNVDLLTGAWNKERFESAFAEVCSRAQRDREPLALIRIDVDNMQEMNDMHGRDRMDGCLAWLAEKVSAIGDGRGPIGRLGGDDFALYMRNCSLEDALHLAERLRRAVPTTLHASAFGDFRLTVSVGVAVNKRGEPWGNLLEAAEQACIRAKQGGRDAVASR